WTACLRPWLEREERDASLAAAGARAAELAHVFPALRDRVAGLPPSESGESDQARFRLFDTVSRFLAAFAASAGLVVVLDDVHWADRPTLKLLEFVAADLRDARLLVVATYRDTEVRREDPFFDTLSRLAREPSTRRVLVARLSAAHCAQWVALAGVRVDAESVGAALHRETNGNPFFLGEVVRLLASEDRLETGWTAGLVPHSVREVVSRRVDRLGPQYRAALGVAALLGDTIEASILAEILAEDSSQIADRLRRAASDRILVELQGRQKQFGFAHALIRRVLADELEPSTRAAWHGRIAAVLERHASSADVAATELVRHFAAAGTPAALRKPFGHP